jgi:FkbM family methyltransferase
MTTAAQAISHPVETLQAFVSLLRTLKRINGLVLEDTLKLKIRNTCLHTCFLKRYDSRKKIANIAGYTVHFLSFVHLIYLFNEIFVNQEYRFTTNKIAPFIIDCGSNIGMSVLYFKSIYPHSEIIAFEPDRDAFGCLTENIRANNLKTVTLNRQALSLWDGEVDFYYDPDDPGSLVMSTVKERMSKHKQVVEAVRLSKYVDREVDFLKIDVEGAEQEILEDLRNEGKLGYIKQLVIEYHHHIAKDVDVLSRMLGLLEEAQFGYQIQGRLSRPLEGERFQDILIYAYQKQRSA